ncbi:hypothetical protein Fmac_031632 [Flemingia macrophylla]|uniref:Uncharacterized protein n=1 Tax=Flemingia macrophylla TaxID=520843 RepID=A0ABD1L2M6_9FABA
MECHIEAMSVATTTKHNGGNDSERDIDLKSPSPHVLLTTDSNGNKISNLRNSLITIR